jgi:hypothetical protein
MTFLSNACHPERSEGSAVGTQRQETVLRRKLASHAHGSTPISRIICWFGTIFVLAQLANACTMAPQPGYFHQVTSIRGRVVGRSLGPLQFGWLRRSFSVSGATLTLYEYPWSATIHDLKRIAEVKTNSKGAFDFGAVLDGHYSLGVSVQGSDSLGGWFPVEVTNKVGRTEEILLDISPIHPDCKGGQEFIERKAKDAASR